MAELVAQERSVEDLGAPVCFLRWAFAALIASAVLWSVLATAAYVLFEAARE
jgi:hypothetical protein